MDMREIFGKALGVDKPWFIADVNFDVKAKRLDIKIDFLKGTTFPFEQDGVVNGAGLAESRHAAGGGP